MAPKPGTTLTLSAAAKLRNIATRTLRGAIARGRLPASRAGRDWFITLADLDAYLARRWQGEAKPGKRKAAAK